MYCACPNCDCPCNRSRPVLRGSSRGSQNFGNGVLNLVNTSFRSSVNMEEQEGAVGGRSSYSPRQSRFSAAEFTEAAETNRNPYAGTRLSWEPLIKECEALDETLTEIERRINECSDVLDQAEEIYQAEIRADAAQRGIPLRPQTPRVRVPSAFVPESKRLTPFQRPYQSR